MDSVVRLADKYLNALEERLVTRDGLSPGMDVTGSPARLWARPFGF